MRRARGLPWRLAGPVLAVLAAGLLLEAGLRWAPRLFPGWLELECLRLRVLLGPRCLIPDAELGVAPSVPFDKSERWSGGRVRLRHVPFPGEVSIGYRAGAEGADPEHVDIAVVGDSHAYGMEVDEKATWESRLSGLTGLTVANLALPFQGTAQEALAFRRYGVRLHPRLVLFTLCPNDAWDNEVFRDWSARRPGLRPPLGYHRFRLQLGWPGPLARLARGAQGSYVLRRLLETVRMRRRAHEFNRTAVQRPQELEALAADADAARAAAGRARFAAILTDIWWIPAFRAQRGPLKEALARRGIPVLDLAEALCAPAGCPEGFYLPMDLHWNERGHERVAEEVKGYLVRERLLPPRRPHAM